MHPRYTNSRNQGQAGEVDVAFISAHTDMGLGAREAFPLVRRL